MSVDRDQIEAASCVLWILTCWAGAIWFLIVGQVGLFFGLAFASLAVPIAMPGMHE